MKEKKHFIVSSNYNNHLRPKHIEYSMSFNEYLVILNTAKRSEESIINKSDF